MAGKIRAWQSGETKEWAGLTKENHIYNFMKTKYPNQLDSAVTRIVAGRDGYLMDNYLDKWPVKYFENNAKLTWDCVKSPRTTVKCVGCKTGAFGDASALSALGENGQPFYIGFEKDWMFKGETIYGPKGNRYPIRIVSDQARMVGTTAWYKVVPFGAKVKTSGIPTSEMKAGAKYSWGPYFVADTLSREGGGVRHNTSFSMESEWSIIRIKDEVVGGAGNWALSVYLPEYTENGSIKLAKTWMEKELYELEVSFKKAKVLAMLYGVSTKDEDGQYSNMDFSGEPIKAGDGLYDQMEYNGIQYYNVMDGKYILRMIEERAISMCAGGKIDPKNRVFIISAGEWGLNLLSEGLTDRMNGWTRLDIDANKLNIVRNTRSELNPNGVSVAINEWQVTEWSSPMGYRFKFQVDTWKDRTDFFKETINGKPIMSYRFDMMYAGDMNSEQGANIVICKEKGRNGATNDFRGYQSGFRNEFTGAEYNESMSFDIDKSVVHLMSRHFAAVLKDPTATAIIAPSALMGY